jgi:hypothetical protein
MLNRPLFSRRFFILFYVIYFVFARGHACEAAVFAQALDKNGNEEVVEHHVQQQNAPTDDYDLSRKNKTQYIY